MTQNSLDINALSGALALTNANLLAVASIAHDAVTLSASSDGLSLSGQELSLAIASSLSTGALSPTDWTIFNNKIDFISLSVTGGLLSYNSSTGEFGFSATTSDIAE